MKLPSKVSITAERLAELSIIFFFLFTLFNVAIRKVVEISGLFGEHSGLIAELLTGLWVYAPLFMACVIRPSKFIKWDFILLWFFVVLFFAGTLFLHPDYLYWYQREQYGAWDHVFSPGSGLYAYLFIRLFDDPKKITEVLRKALWMRYVFCAYQIYCSVKRGFWYGVLGANNRAEFSYSISFGYQVLLYTLLFMCFFIKDKRKTDMLGAALGLFMTVKYGSRGPTLFIIMYIAAVVFLEFSRNTKTAARVAGFSFITLSVITVAALYEKLIILLGHLLTKVNINSRFINKLVEGDISDDAGRSKIWGEAIRMIRQKPFGYGAMGSQHRISRIISAGYPHSIIFEILIDFGVIVGGALLVFFAVKCVQIILLDHSEWSDLFLPFFCTSCALFLSMTFWATPSFWFCLGVGVSWHISKKRGTDKRITADRFLSKLKIKVKKI